MTDDQGAKTSSNPMQILLAVRSEEDFLRLRDLLARSGRGEIGLDQAKSLEEALILMSGKSYDLLLCDFKPASNIAMQILHETREDGPGLPMVFLSDHVDEATLAAAIRAGAYDCVQVSALDEASLTRTIRYAVEMYGKDQQREKAEDMLRKLWRAVEQSADMVIITDRSGIVEYVNPAFESLTGYSKQEAIGRSPRILKSGQHSLQFYRDMWETILSGTVYRASMVNRKKSGEIFYAEKTITPLRDAEGRITHFISNDRDITGRRTLELQLQQSQKMDAIGRLAAGVAHDFNNLLMVISANAELTLEALSEDDPRRNKVEEVQSAARRAAELTRQLLAFGRKQVQSLQVLDLNQLLQDISRILPRLIGEDIRLAVAPGKDLGRIKADPVQIEQVVMNLAANARDAMPHGGRLTLETMNVTLDHDYARRHSMVPAGEYVLLAVTDSGEGIAPEHMANIFEPFYTTKPEGKGTGLGLATVYGIIKQSGGFIWVYSEPGLGTTFKIYLPRVQKAVPIRRSEPPLVDQCPRGTETVLLVEDEPAVRSTAGEFLVQTGYKVLEAKDGENAIAVARSYPGDIHLMITDVVMPNMGGAKLAEHLAGQRPEMKVLFVSGYAENTVVQQGPIDVAGNFLQKPFGLKMLARKVREVLGAEGRGLARAASRSSPDNPHGRRSPV